MRTFARALLISLVVALCALPLLAAGPKSHDLKIIGTWKLNLAKSTYITGPVPNLVSVHTWWWEGDTLKHKVARLNAQGELVGIGGQWSAEFDAKDHLSGGENESKVSMKILDTNHTEMSEGVPGTPLSHFEQIVSKDGKTLTIRRKIDGKKGVDIMVHDRQ